MNYDHETINHGCQGTAGYFSTLLHALSVADNYSSPDSDFDSKINDAIRRVSEDLLETLDKHCRKVKVYTATAERNIRRKVSVEARDDDEAARKLHEVLNPDETIGDIESEGRP